MNTMRKKKCEEAEEKGYRVLSYIHPSAIV